jgi:uroporphyrin-III C-methyltransferase
MSEAHGSNDSDGKNESDNESVNAEVETPRRARAPGKALAILALLVALATAAGLAWMWSEQTGPDFGELASAEDLDVLSESLAEQSDRLHEQSARLESVEERFDRLETGLADLRQALRERGDETDDLGHRLSDLEATLDEAVERLEDAAGDQRAVDRELARRLNLMEAAALLRGGQQRAELAADYSGARAAYRRAYRLMRDFDDPRGNRARGLVAQELEALEDMAEPDWTAMDAQLDRLAVSIEQWPAASVAGMPAAAEEDDEEAAGWWSRAGSTLAGLVRVQPRDSIAISAEELDAVREHIRLRLVAAEVALARRDLEEVARQLGRAEEHIERWFDTGDTAVQRGLSTLNDLAATEPAELPTLGAALAEVQRLLEDS